MAGNVNMIPAHKEPGLSDPEPLEDSICVDQWYIESVPNPSGITEPFAAIGRFPAWNLHQLQTMISKTIAYEGIKNCSWARRLISVADWYEPDGNDFESGAQEFNRMQYPLFTDTSTICLQPLELIQEKREHLRALWNDGAGMVSFFGHANFWTFSHEHFFTTFDVDSLSNGTMLPFYTGFCFSQRFDKLDTMPTVVNLLQSEGRGAIATLICPALTYFNTLRVYFDEFVKQLKNNPDETAGKAMMYARNTFSSVEMFINEIRKYTLLGDPALEIKNAYITADITSAKNVAGEFMLNQNYPNPFNPETIISFDLPKTAHVKLSIYNILGQEIATLVNTELSKGSHYVRFNAGNLKLTSGMYIYRLKTENSVLAKKMMYMQ